MAHALHYYESHRNKEKHMEVQVWGRNFAGQRAIAVRVGESEYALAVLVGDEWQLVDPSDASRYEAVRRVYCEVAAARLAWLRGES